MKLAVLAKLKFSKWGFFEHLTLVAYCTLCNFESLGISHSFLANAIYVPKVLELAQWNTHEFTQECSCI